MSGPLLVVADNDAIARGAPGWAERFLAAGVPYRVRLAGDPGAREVERLVAEARSLGATRILTAGAAPARALAAAVAFRLGLPLSHDDADVVGER